MIEIVKNISGMLERVVARDCKIHAKKLHEGLWELQIIDKVDNSLSLEVHGNLSVLARLTSDAEQRRVPDPAEQKSAVQLPEWYQMAKDFFGEVKVFSMEMYQDMNGESILNQLRSAAEREAKAQISERSAGG